MLRFENIKPEHCAVLMISDPERGDLYYQNKSGGNLICTQSNYLPNLEKFHNFDFYIGIPEEKQEGGE